MTKEESAVLRAAKIWARARDREVKRYGLTILPSYQRLFSATMRLLKSEQPRKRVKNE